MKTIAIAAVIAIINAILGSLLIKHLRATTHPDLSFKSTTDKILAIMLFPSMLVLKHAIDLYGMTFGNMPKIFEKKPLGSYKKYPD